MKELLTIPEFVELSGKKKQGIYQQIRNENSRLYQYVVIKGKRAFIKREALQFYREDTEADSKEEGQAEGQSSQAEGQADSQSGQSESKTEGQSGQADSQAESQSGQGATPPPTSEAERFILFLQEQIREKDKQIAEKDKQIAGYQEELRAAQKIIDQEQQLHAHTKKYLPQAQEEKEGNAFANDTATQEEGIEPGQEQKKKRNKLLRWLLGEE